MRRGAAAESQSEAPPVAAPPAIAAVGDPPTGGYCAFHDLPPSILAMIVLSSPTAQAWSLSAKETPYRPLVVSEIFGLQALPALEVLMTVPLSPTARPVFLSRNEMANSVLAVCECWRLPRVARVGGVQHGAVLAHDPARLLVHELHVEEVVVGVRGLLRPGAGRRSTVYSSVPASPTAQPVRPVHEPDAADVVALRLGRQPLPGAEAGAEERLSGGRRERGRGRRRTAGRGRADPRAPCGAASVTARAGVGGAKSDVAARCQLAPPSADVMTRLCR